MSDPIQILLVEDNPADVRLTKEAFSESRINNELHVVVDGAAALDYLMESGNGSDRVVPDLVLLDLNLPKINGLEVLRQIRKHELLKMIPVIILTSSSSPEDINDCYTEGANCYISKPHGYDAFLEVVTQIEDFWLTVVHLPRT